MLKRLFIIGMMLASNVAWGQNDLLKELDQVQDSVVNYSAATFKGTRIITAILLKQSEKTTLTL